MSKSSIEHQVIKMTNGNELNWRSIPFKDTVDTHPYFNSGHVDTVSDWDGVWRKDPLGKDSWKTDPDISSVFERVIQKSEELYIVTARTRSRRISLLPFISGDQIEEMDNHVRTINPSCKLFFVCGLEKIFSGNIVGEIIRRKVDQEHHVGVWGSNRRDKFLNEKIHKDLGENKSQMTIFDMCRVIV